MHKIHKYVGIGEAATALGVSASTLHRRDASGKLEAETTRGGHRRFDLAKLRLDLFHAGNDIQRKSIAYARVSSHDQKAGLERQKQVLELYCAQQGWTFEVVILNAGKDSTFEEDLATDVLEIISVFSARLYGARSRKNQKLLDHVRNAVEQSQC